ncbi:hypothetical protein AB1I63_10025 [Streptococcus pneumoniae]
MKKVALRLLLATATISLVACSKAEKSHQVSQETSSTVEVVTESSSESKSKQDNYKVTPADYSRIPKERSVSEEVKKAIKEYIGVYSGTENIEENGIITKVSYEVEITDDGVYNVYIESRLMDSSQKVEGQLYVNTKGELDIIRSKGELGTGTVAMAYGQLEFSPLNSLRRGYVNEAGELLPVYGGGSRSAVSIPTGRVLLVDGKIKYGNEYDKDAAITLEKQKKASQNLQYTTYQILEYSKSLPRDRDVYQFDTLNEFIQAMDIDGLDAASLRKSYQIVDPASLKGYYTEDNQEITGIKYAYGYHRENEKGQFYVYDGKLIYELQENDKGQKIAREVSRSVYDFVDFATTH